MVHEDGLANGTNPGHQITASGSLSIESEDGLAAIKIAGMTLSITAVDPETGVVSYETEGSETVPHGDFSVSGITAVNGVYTVYYCYTLTENSLDHTLQNAKADTELLPEPIKISIEAIDVDNDSTGESYFTLDILDDNPLTNSDWVRIDPESSGTVYGNLNDGYWGASKGEYTNSAAESGQGDGAADNWGADGGRVSKVWIHSDGGAQGKGYDVPVDGYVDVPTESGTLRIYSNGEYEFSPTLSNDVILYHASGDVHPTSNSDHDLLTAGYRVEAMSYNLKTGAFTNQDLHITNNSGGEMGNLIGVKHGDSIGKSNDDTPGAYGHKNEMSTAGGDPEGLLITVPDSLASYQMTFGLVNFRDGVEQANWIVYYADGHTETGHSNSSAFSIDLHEGVTQVFLYANDDGVTSFYVDKIAATETIEVPFHDVCFDYQVTDGDGDTSVSQLHIHDDGGSGSSSALSAPAGHEDSESGATVHDPYHPGTDDQGNGNEGSGSQSGGNIVIVDESGSILNGETGNDIFTWKAEAGGEHAADSPTTDIIRDFSMDGLAGKGDDHLDLRDLLSNAREDNLDNYMTINKNGDDAELHIHLDGNPGGGASKIIVLENVYSSHSDSGINDTAAVDELIKQHIILNS